MAILEHEGLRPKIDPTARIAPIATVCGDVTVGPNTYVGFGAVIVAESGPVEIGANCVIMDTAVLRGLKHAKLTLGDNVLVGPRAYMPEVMPRYAAALCRRHATDCEVTIASP